MMKSRYWYYIIFGGCAVLFYYINASIPIISDDILYSYIFPNQTDLDTPWGVDMDNPINDIHDVFVSQYNHYFYHGGRTPVHILVQLFSALWGKTVFSFITVFFFVAFIWLLGLSSFNNNKERIIFFIPFFLLFVFIVQPKCFYSTIATSINYLWASVVCLAYYYFYEQKVIKTKILIAVYWGMAFVAGWSHEGIVIPLGAAIFFKLIIDYKTIPNYNKISIVFFIVGAALLLFAPGNFSRGAENNSSISIKSIAAFFYYLRVFWLYLLGLLVVFLSKGRKDIIKELAVDRCLLSGVVCGIFIFVCSGVIVLRLGYGVDLLCCILFSRLLSRNVSFLVLNRIGVFSLVATTLLLGTVCYYQGASKKQFDLVIKSIEESDNKTLVINVPIAHQVPQILERYVRSLTNDSAKEWMIDVWEAKYDKEMILINEEKY